MLEEAFLIIQVNLTNKINLEAIYDFEGAYTDIVDPGYYVVSRKNNLISDSQEEDCIKIILEVRDRTLFCDFEILTDDIDDNYAYKLISKYLLQKFCNNYYKDMASMIEFRNVVSNIKHLTVMN